MAGKYKRYLNLFKNFSNWYTYLGVKAGWVQSDPVQFQTRNGVKLEVPRNLLREFKEIFFEENYLNPLGLRQETVCSVVDIGANVGFFSLLASHAFPQADIFAYEPIPTNFKWLERHKTLNPYSHLTCFQKAVGGNSGEIELHWTEGDESLTTSATVLENSQGSSTLKVSCTTLDAILDQNRLSHIDLLKMDCEGAEYDILYRTSDNTLQRIRNIAMEVHGGSKPEHHLEPLAAFLGEKGFEVTHRGNDRLALLWAVRN